jgi:hypothetical protein
MTIRDQFADTTRTHFLSRAVEWLRAGYPAGVPPQDYVVLLGLLRRKLTDVEVQQIAAALVDQADVTDGAISADEIADMVKDSVLQDASSEDITRVSARLAAGGWPLADPPTE